MQAVQPLLSTLRCAAVAGSMPKVKDKHKWKKEEEKENENKFPWRKYYNSVNAPREDGEEEIQFHCKRCDLKFGEKLGWRGWSSKKGRSAGRRTLINHIWQYHVKGDRAHPAVTIDERPSLPSASPCVEALNMPPLTPSTSLPRRGCIHSGVVRPCPSVMKVVKRHAFRPGPARRFAGAVASRSRESSTPVLRR